MEQYFRNVKEVATGRVVGGLQSSSPLDTAPTDPQVHPPGTEDTPILSPALPKAVEHRAVIYNNNSNTNYIFGQSIINNSNFYNVGGPDVSHYGRIALHGAPYTVDVVQQEKDMKVIRTVIDDRFVREALHEAQLKNSGCAPGTRTTVLAECMTWVSAWNTSPRILWLAGMPGTGKTSIAITLCRDLQHDSSVLLGGAFFCSRTAGSVYQADAHCILPTLAVCLAVQSPLFAEALATELRADDLGSQRQASDQIVHLFIKPLAALASTIRPVVFIIDGLDECSNERELSELLAAIANFGSNLRVRFILTSRLGMNLFGIPISDPRNNDILQLRTLGPDEAKADIYQYIDFTFSNDSWSVGWCSEADSKALADLAQGVFILASTAVRYILNTESTEPRIARLHTILAAMKDKNIAVGSPDAMYDLVMTRASASAEIKPDELYELRKILACILTARKPLSVGALAELIGIGVGNLRMSLWRLHAVVHVPVELDQSGIRALHASFADYLFDRAAKHMRITRSLGDTLLAGGCLQVMAGQLHFNISRNRSSYDPNRFPPLDIIRPSLEYAFIQWIYHIANLPDPSLLDKDISDVFPPRFLFWLEVASVLGRVRDAAMTLLFAASIVRRKELSQFMRDALAFVTFSHDAIERSAPHIYISALPLAYKDSLIYKTFAPLCTGLISVETSGIDQHGGQLLMMLDGHRDSVNSLTYSPDGSLIASCSDDGTVRIWDARTGEYAMSLPFSTDGPVHSAAFAPNGRSIISGTDTGKLWFCSVSNSQPPRRLYGHSAAILSTAFSPDGSVFASASRDSTARLWCGETGKLLAVLAGHTGGVTAIAFSYNCELVSSCSVDHTIRLWHARTGEPAGNSLLGHTGWVIDLSFSPVSMVLASASSDCTIRLWNVQTGWNIATLSGHLDRISSVQFSSDGKALVSAAQDHTVRLWPLGDGVAENSSVVLDRHARPVRSAIFSPDGLYIASGSEDNTIRIWDAGIGHEEVQSLSAHDSAVRSIAVSADGASIISGSDDRTIRVWNAQTGEPSLSPLQGHTDAVTSVAIVLERSLILSASLNHVVRFWDLKTGLLIGESLDGRENQIGAVGIAPNARWLASGSLTGIIHVWDSATRRQSKIGPLLCDNGVLTIAFSFDGVLLAAGDLGGRIHIWYTETGCAACEPMQTSIFGVNTMAFSHDRTRILSSARESEPCVWDIETGQLAFVLGGWKQGILSAVYSSDGQFICSGSVDGSVSLWNAEDGMPIFTLHGHGGSVYSVTFIPDKRSVVSCSSDATIRVWDVDIGLKSLPEHRISALTSLAFTGLDNGWLLGPSGELLQWVPEEYRNCLLVPPCQMLIGRRRVIITAGTGDLHYGKNWISCWRQAPWPTAGSV